MTDLPQDVKRHLAESKQPLGIKELLKLTQLHPGQQTQLKRALRDMVRTGDLLKEGKRFRLRGSQPPGSQEGGSGGGGSRPPTRRELLERPQGAWSKEPQEERGASGSGPRPPSESDARFAPRGRFEKEHRPEPRGRFVREGRADRPQGPVQERGGQQGRFARPERPESTHRPAPPSRFSPSDRSARPEQRRPASGGGSFREDRFAPRDRGGRGSPQGRETVSVEGIFHAHRDGFGFVHPSSGQGDNIFLP
ncbi:MAG: ribonuclease R, partial [Cystobacter sp.]